MLALYAIAHAYALAIICAGLRTSAAVATKPATQPSPQGRPPAESALSAPHTIVKAPTPVLQWPRDN